VAPTHINYINCLYHYFNTTIIPPYTTLDKLKNIKILYFWYAKIIRILGISTLFFVFAIDVSLININ